MNPYACSYCGAGLEDKAAPNFSLKRTRDHIHPKSQGGTTTVPCCRGCNTVKADMALTDWLLLVAQHRKADGSINRAALHGAAARKRKIDRSIERTRKEMERVYGSLAVRTA